MIDSFHFLLLVANSSKSSPILLQTFDDYLPACYPEPLQRTSHPMDHVTQISPLHPEWLISQLTDWLWMYEKLLFRWGYAVQYTWSWEINSSSRKLERCRYTSDSWAIDYSWVIPDGSKRHVLLPCSNSLNQNYALHDVIKIQNRRTYPTHGLYRYSDDTRKGRTLHWISTCHFGSECGAIPCRKKTSVRHISRLSHVHSL